MARVAFFFEALPPDADLFAEFAFNLVLSLADQGHEIRIFSTYYPGAELPPTHPRVEIFRPFKKWNWIEIPAVVPLLAEFQPDIMHFIQSHKNTLTGFSNAISAVSAVATHMPLLNKMLGATSSPTFNRPAIVTSFYDLEENSLRKNYSLVKSSDALTVANTPQFLLLEKHLKRTSRKNPNQNLIKDKITILPILVPGSKQNDREKRIKPSKERYWPSSFAENRTVVFIPGNIIDHLQPKSLFLAISKLLAKRNDTVVVVGGDWGKITSRDRQNCLRSLGEHDSRFLLTGPLSTGDEVQILAESDLVFIASLPSASIRVTRWLRLSLATCTPAVLSQDQANTDPLGWCHKQNSIIAPSFESWSSTLIEAISSAELLETIRHQLPEFLRTEALDQPGNAMSRIYARILDSKRVDPDHSRT